LPAVALLLGLSFAYVFYGALPAVQAALVGLKAVVVALIVHAVIRIGRRALRGALPAAASATMTAAWRGPADTPKMTGRV
jgi:chromate transporter